MEIKQILFFLRLLRVKFINRRTNAVGTGWQRDPEKHLVPFLPPPPAQVFISDLYETMSI